MLLVMIEKINSGYLALAIVGSLFFALQIWWLSMTVKNGRVLQSQDNPEEIKRKLEKIFSKS